MILLVGSESILGGDNDVNLDGVVLPQKDHVRSLRILLDLAVILEKLVMTVDSLAFDQLQLVHQLL